MFSSSSKCISKLSTPQCHSALAPLFKIRFNQSEGTRRRFSSCQLQKLDHLHLLHQSVKQMRSPLCTPGLHELPETAQPHPDELTPCEPYMGLLWSPLVSGGCPRQAMDYAAQGRRDCSFMARSSVDLNIYCKNQMTAINIKYKEYLWLTFTVNCLL